MDGRKRSQAWLVVVLGVGSGLLAAVPLFVTSLVPSESARIAAVVVCTSAGALFGLWVSEKRTAHLVSVPAMIMSKDLEPWRELLRNAVLKRRVREGGSQLDQMVSQDIVLKMRAQERVPPTDDDAGSTGLRMRGRMLQWPKITEKWARAPARMVILGEPGYGKTVAALTLLNHINNPSYDDGVVPKRKRRGDRKGRARNDDDELEPQDRSGQPLAELFSLGEWYPWHAQHPKKPLSDWLADQLATTYGQIWKEFAEALVQADVLIPLLDGLDEVPIEHRWECKQAIDAYAGRVPKFRRFVLTCRTREYDELAPEWVTADREIELLGLGPNEVRSELNRRTRGRPGWAIMRERVAAGDQALLELFRSPLNMTTALRAYRNGDVSELLEHDANTVEGHLWDQLLSLNAATFEGGKPEQVRKWLRFLAEGMKRQGRQRFSLHQLYLFAPAPRIYEFQFVTRVMQISLVAVGVMSGLTASLTAGAKTGVTVGMVVGSGFALATKALSKNLEPLVSATMPWGARVQEARKDPRVNLSPALLAGVLPGIALGTILALAIGLTAGRFAGLAAGLITGLSIVVGGGLIGLLERANAVMNFAPPPRLTQRDPAWVLTANRNEGVRLGLVAGLVTGPPCGIAVGLAKGLSAGVGAGLVAALVIGLLVGLHGGLLAWLYHHWLRRLLGRQDVLPRVLPDFLKWCAKPERGWLRVSEAYEFRHRGLLDHLAAQAEPNTQSKPSDEEVRTPGVRPTRT